MYRDKGIGKKVIQRLYGYLADDLQEVSKMAEGIMIMGASGAGKTTLGKMVAGKLGYRFVDIDEYIWRKDEAIPFSKIYPKKEKISRLMAAISGCEHFVMAGSMDSFHEYFDSFFKLVVYLHADVRLRVKRVHERELELFGERILEGGDMYEKHQMFLNDVAGYDDGMSGCTLQQYEAWLKSLQCKVIRLDGAQELEKNLKIVIDAYRDV